MESLASTRPSRPVGPHPFAEMRRRSRFHLLGRGGGGLQSFCLISLAAVMFTLTVEARRRYANIKSVGHDKPGQLRVLCGVEEEGLKEKKFFRGRANLHFSKDLQTLYNKLPRLGVVHFKAFHDDANNCTLAISQSKGKNSFRTVGPSIIAAKKLKGYLDAKEDDNLIEAASPPVFHLPHFPTDYMGIHQLLEGLIAASKDKWEVVKPAELMAKVKDDSSKFFKVEIYKKGCVISELTYDYIVGRRTPARVNAEVLFKGENGSIFGFGESTLEVMNVKTGGFVAKCGDEKITVTQHILDKSIERVAVVEL
eukprot:GHVS01059824.1.p1 GENE.GHVS01059824.1~~GHVS01059824.1.p1  ORF type:complete len:353 (+),score=19.32 GHVS01059824.1:131-1060(+)